jgi:hypothetical protein
MSEQHVQMPEAVQWAEEAGYRIVATYLPGLVGLRFEETDNSRDFTCRASVTIARYRWDRIVQAMALIPEDLRGNYWQPFENAPKDGFGFLAYGRHAEGSGRVGSYEAGDHWWAIIQWDVWREPHQFVFGKDGRPIADWGKPLFWKPLDIPGESTI